jgi:hypothetical protein
MTSSSTVQIASIYSVIQSTIHYLKNARLPPVV